MIPPNLKDCENILNSLLQIARKYDLDLPYVFGGRVRNHLFKIDSTGDDLDITTNSSECIRLGVLFASEKKEVLRIFEDRHIKILHEGKAIDFSSGILSFTTIRMGLRTCIRYVPAFSFIHLFLKASVTFIGISL